MRRDLIASIGLLLIAAAYYAATTTIQESTLGQDEPIGPTGLPTILAALLAVIALIIGARALLAAPARGKTSDDDEEAEAPWPRALGLLVLGSFYIPLAYVLGYPLALFLLIAGISLYEGLRPDWRVFAVAIGGTAIFWLIFDVILGVRQPEGILF